MSDNPPDRLGDLADAVAEEFDSYRDPSELKTTSLVIDDSSNDRRTLIVHVDGEDAPTLADEVETFLHGQSATTEREVHSEQEVRVLATVD